MHRNNLHSLSKKAIVIGGGIAGCSTAYALAKRGVSVTLIERHSSIAQEASGNPVAMLYPKFSQNSLFTSQGFAFTLDLLNTLQDTQSNCDERLFQLCGQIQLAHNQREQEKQRLLLDKKSEHKSIQSVTAAQASEIAQIKLTHGGLYIPDSGWVKPTLFCEALLSSNLITRIVSTEAIQIKQTSEWIVSLADQQQFNADIVVLCNANALHQFDHCKNIPITSVRGQVNFFESNAISEVIQPILCSDHFLSPAVDGIHSIGTTYAPNDTNPAVTNEDTQANLHALKQISPALYNLIQSSPITGRVAWRSATRDYMPLAGQLIDETALRRLPPRYNDQPSKLPWLAGLYVNAGHGSKGMITAPICGELIASMVAAEPIKVDLTNATKLNPSRFLLRQMGLKQIAQNLYPF